MGRARLSNVVIDWVNAFAYDGKLILILSLCCIHSSTACTPRSLICSSANTCPCTANSVSDSGVITEGLGIYTNNMNCVFKFHSSAIVNVQVTQFATEINRDWFSIIICADEACVSSLTLLRHSGSFLGYFANVYNTTTSHRFMQVQFTSNPTVTLSGWTARWWISSIISCNCLAGSYGISAGCTACALQSTSPAGSTVITQCICNSESTGPNGGPCAQCAAGKYKSTPGTSACADCPLRSTSFADGTGITACVCNAGSTGPDAGP